MNFIFLRFFPLLLLFFSCHVIASEFAGVVVKVSDGDTITVLTPEKSQVRVRLAQIDAPESGQPWGKRSGDYLRSLLAGKQVRVEVVDTDRYGRTVGTVYLGDLDVCREQVRLGNAWVYRAYLKDASLLEVEHIARDTRVGLWGLPDHERVAPWEYRKGVR